MASDTILVVASVLAHKSNTNWVQNKNLPEDYESGNNKKFSTKNSVFYNFFSRPFLYIIALTIATLSIFWMLSLSMFVYLAIIGVYQLIIANKLLAFSNSTSISKNMIKITL